MVVVVQSDDGREGGVVGRILKTEKEGTRTVPVEPTGTPSKDVDAPPSHPVPGCRFLESVRRRGGLDAVVSVL